MTPSDRAGASETEARAGASRGRDAWGERLPRRLGTWSAIAVLVGSTIGSGIFRSPAAVAETIADLPTFAIAWILGGVVALAGALTFAELAAMFPRTGGMYVYLREAFGPTVAFLFGWSELIVLRPAAYGAIAVISAEYLWRLVGVDGGRAFAFTPLSWAQVTAAGLIVVVGVVNYRGIRLGAIIQNVSTALKIGALLLLVLVGLWVVPEVVPSSAAAELPPRQPLHPVVGFGVALVGVFWAYDGWSDVGFVGGEVRDPARGLPRAFILGTAIVVALYLAINAVYLAVVPLEHMPGRPLIAADVAEALMGPVGAVFVSAAVMISTFGTLNGSMMTGPRVFFAMAEDDLFFERLARVHPVHGTPSGAIVLSIVLGVGFVSLRSFSELADQFVLGIWPFYALTVAAVIVLRTRRPELARPYRAWGYPIVPILFLLAAVFVLGVALLEDPVDTLVSAAVVLSGIPVFHLWRARRRPRPRR